jgi:TIR domain
VIAGEIMSRAVSPKRIFINYRREDTSAYAGRIYDHLTRQYGEEQVFIDVSSIPAGADFIKALADGLSGSQVLLVLIGQEWLTVTDGKGSRRLDGPHDFVRAEIEAALIREIPVLPVIIDGGKMPRTPDLPKSLAPLARRQKIEIRHSSFEADMTRLFIGINSALGMEPGPIYRGAGPQGDGLRSARASQAYQWSARVVTSRPRTFVLMINMNETHIIKIKIGTADEVRLDGQTLPGSASAAGAYKLEIDDGGTLVPGELVVDVADFLFERISKVTLRVQGRLLYTNEL